MRKGRGPGLVLALAVFGAAPSAWGDADQRVSYAQGEVAGVGRAMGGVSAAMEKGKVPKRTAEERLASGELLYRTKDYDRAIVVFSEILEEFPNTPSYPDALWLRGETYYAAHEYLAARRDYRALVDRGSEPRFQAYMGRALARLVDVSLRLNDPPESLNDVFNKFALVPASQVDAGLLYAKGKALYRRQDWSAADQVFKSVQAGTPYTHQARYFQGLITMKQARAQQGASAASDPSKVAPAVNYKPAIEAFRQVTVLPPDTADHQHVIDLSWMAIGRLFYEMEQYQAASEAYAKVSRESPEFDTMLYELAWVYVRLGDVQRAERALEVLSISDPGSSYIGDGTLLRADLLLRAGAFDKSLQLYQSVRSQYDPMRAKVETFLDSTQDIGAYYDKLAQQQLDVLDQNEQLPPIAVRWAREAEDGPAAFAVIDDLNECKRLIRESNVLIDKLMALTGAANRVRAFPDLHAGEETALGLLNRIAKARMSIGSALDDEEPGDLSGEIGQVRAQRRQLMANVEQLPVTGNDFGERDRQGQVQWNRVSQELSRRSLEVDHLQANVNGLRRMLREDAQRGIARDPASVQRFTAEIDSNERDLKRYRELISDVRRQIDIGRAQVGLGDARFQNDAVARLNFRDALEREVQLAAQGQAGGDAQRLAAKVQSTLVQAHQYEDQLVSTFEQMEAQVAKKTEELRAKIQAEQANIVRYQAQLDGLDSEARDLVGNVAKRNFGLVREKLRGIVLRADVGITEQAWEVREEELDRVRNLQTERARQEQLLDEELKEVRDDGVDPAPTSPSPPAAPAPAGQK